MIRAGLNTLTRRVFSLYSHFDPDLLSKQTLLPLPPNATAVAFATYSYDPKRPIAMKTALIHCLNARITLDMLSRKCFHIIE
jgi:hypothetical protein